MTIDPAALAGGRDHECTFVEEQEPSGRLILGLQAIVALHAADVDGNCGHCTRGRVYPVPAPCETVRALAGGGEGR